MLLCPSNSGAAVVEFSTTAPQNGDTAEQMLAKLLSVGSGEHITTSSTVVTGMDPPLYALTPRAGRSSITLSSLASNTADVFLFFSSNEFDLPDIGFGHPLVPGGSITLSRQIHGNLDNMNVIVSALSGDQTLIKTDW